MGAFHDFKQRLIRSLEEQRGEDKSILVACTKRGLLYLAKKMVVDILGCPANVKNRSDLMDINNDWWYYEDKKTVVLFDYPKKGLFGASYCHYAQGRDPDRIVWVVQEIVDDYLGFMVE